MLRNRANHDRAPAVMRSCAQDLTCSRVGARRQPREDPIADPLERGDVARRESVEDALDRELYEELGVRITACRVFDAVEFSYPHARVRLHFRLVTAWSGEPRAREGQALAWQQPGAITVSPLLPASLPVIERLAVAGSGNARGLST
jgi:mutator protein MutT